MGNQHGPQDFVLLGQISGVNIQAAIAGTAPGLPQRELGKFIQGLEQKRMALAIGQFRWIHTHRLDAFGGNVQPHRAKRRAIMRVT